MSILERIGKLFGKGKPTLKSLSADDLKREHISVETEWNKLIEESEKFVADDAQLKEEYKAAHAAGKTPLKRIIAQKIQTLDLKRKGTETRLAYTTKMLQTVTGLLTIKENMVFFEKLGVGSLLATMDIDELERFVLDATVEGTLQQDKLAAALQGITGGIDALSQSSGDPGIDEFMDNLDAELLDAPTTEMPGLSAADVDKMHESLDAVAAKGLDAARKIRQAQQPEQENVWSDRQSSHSQFPSNSIIVARFSYSLHSEHSTLSNSSTTSIFSIVSVGLTDIDFSPFVQNKNDLSEREHRQVKDFNAF